MQTGLSATDRKIMWAALAAFGALSLATVLLAPSPDSDFSSIPSTYSSTPAGARAAFLLLQQLAIPVQRWQEPPFRLAEGARNATLVLAEPSEIPSHGDRQALRDFVNAGGRVLFCGVAFPRFFSGVQLRPVPKVPAPFGPQQATLGAEQYSASFPTGNEPKVELRPAAFWMQFSASQVPVFGEQNNAVVAAWKIGKGEVIWWAAATPLTNAGLNWASNLSVFLNSIGPGRRVYWDEYFHGERGGLWSYIDRTTVLWAVVQIAFITVAALFTFSRRSGPVIPGRHISRLSPLEFVQTLGGLYRRGKATPIAIEISLGELRLKLARRLGLSVSSTDQDFAAAAAERLQWDGAALQQVLVEAHAASTSPYFPPRQALALVRSMQEFSARVVAVQDRNPGQEKPPAQENP